VYTLAQARTSTLILRLDSEHNESVTRFLINSGLAVGSEASARLLREITLSHATLSNAYLPNADLRHADLSGANLSDADLNGADLSDAALSGVTLFGADLEDARGITKEQLEKQAATLEGAIMPDGSKHP